MQLKTSAFHTLANKNKNKNNQDVDFCRIHKNHRHPIQKVNQISEETHNSYEVTIIIFFYNVGLIFFITNTTCNS